MGQMVRDPFFPGVFKAYGKMREMFAQEIECFVEVFRVVVDDDPGQAFYPEVDGAGCGEVIVRGPDGGGKAGSVEKNFVIRSQSPWRRFVISFDPNADDRRKRVTWD